MSETLEERRDRVRLMETYKYLNIHYKTPPERFFKLNGERTLINQARSQGGFRGFSRTPLFTNPP